MIVKTPGSQAPPSCRKKGKRSERIFIIRQPPIKEMIIIVVKTSGSYVQSPVVERKGS